MVVGAARGAAESHVDPTNSVSILFSPTPEEQINVELAGRGLHTRAVCPESVECAGRAGHSLGPVWWQQGALHGL